MEGLTFHAWVSREVSWPTLEIKYSTQMCKQCTNDQENGCVGLLTSNNNMNPGRVPPPLKDLSVVEEMLIAQIEPMMHIFRFPAGRQFEHRGHVLNLLQNVQSVLTLLPRTNSNLGMVIVRQTRTSGKVNDFRVRRQRVLEALVNLKRNNKYYENIEIDSEALEVIPEDGENLHVIRADNDDASFEDISPVGANIDDEAKDTNENEDDAVYFSHSVLTSVALKLNSKENGDQQDHMGWLTYGSNPISEFTTEVYL